MTETRLRLGVCTSLENAAAVAAGGADYVELSVANDLIPGSDAAEWAVRRRAIESLPVPVEAFNVLLTGRKIVGPEADTEWLGWYADRALARAAEVGGKVVVFGSGGARRVPDDFPREQAESQIISFLNQCADAADKHGIILVIEPLNRGESNILNSVAEGAEYVCAVDRASIRLLADTYHMEKDSEPLSAIVDHGDLLAHTHTADTGRRAPGTGTFDHVALFRQLHAAGYKDRLSIECGWEDFAAQVGAALAHLRDAERVALTQG